MDTNILISLILKYDRKRSPEHFFVIFAINIWWNKNNSNMKYRYNKLFSYPWKVGDHTGIYQNHRREAARTPRIRENCPWLEVEFLCRHSPMWLHLEGLLKTRGPFSGDFLEQAWLQTFWNSFDFFSELFRTTVVENVREKFVVNLFCNKSISNFIFL